MTGEPGAPAPPRWSPRCRRWLRSWMVVAAGMLLVAAGIGVAVRAGSFPPRSAAAPPAPSVSSPTAGSIQGGLDDQIAGLQAHLKDSPNDADGWGTLGLAYVQEGKNTVNPMYYPKAEAALQRSLSLTSSGNYVGLAGLAALRTAEHRFTEALSLAQQANAINPSNATIYGTLADAYTQLGRYDQAAAAVQHMLDLRPGTPAFTRAEYVYELRGQIPQAREAMAQALGAASTPADQAFCHYYLAELAFTGGDPAGALTEINLGLAADPRYPDLLEGKAKAEAALGQVDAAVADYAQVVATVPQPQYVIEAGEYLQSLGRTDQARQDYQLFDAENALFQANGVQLDTDPTLFYADHGDPAKALQFGQAGITIRPFLEMDDAYGWALHANHRDAEALPWAQKATATGMRNALFCFHQAVIEAALGQTGAARADLTQALAINPHFNPLLAPLAQQSLQNLGTR